MRSFPSRTHLAIGVALLTAGLWIACSSAPPPKPAPPPLPDSTEKLVRQLTEWLKLDASQQAKTRELARALVDRNQKIMDNWKVTKKPRPEELTASGGQFQAEFVAILSPEQRKTFAETSSRIMTKGLTGHR
jgi:hypothetical protein